MIYFLGYNDRVTMDNRVPFHCFICMHGRVLGLSRNITMQHT